MLPRSTEIQPYVASIRPSPLPPRPHPGTRGHRGCDGPSARPATEKTSPQVPGPPPHRASAPVEGDNIFRAPDGPGKRPRRRTPSPGPSHPGTCSGRRSTISSHSSAERARVIVPKSDIRIVGDQTQPAGRNSRLGNRSLRPSEAFRSGKSEQIPSVDRSL